MNPEVAPPVAYRPDRLTYELLKRAFDILAGSLLLVLFSGVFLLVAMMVRRSSYGPVLYRQVRVGRGNRQFLIYKFRTMYMDADQSGPQITATDDDRITPVGRWLRTTKLDELPQLINVVLGHMSLVGPRPQVPKFVNEFPPDHRDIVLAVRPGITGPTQLEFRNEEQMLEGKVNREQYYIERLLPIKCRMDVEYVLNRSLSTDVGVLLKTSMLFARGTMRRLYRRADTAFDRAVVEPIREEKAEKRKEKADVLT